MRNLVASANPVGAWPAFADNRRTVMYPLQTQISSEKLNYTGAELKPHFLLTHFGLQGSALAAFRGACSVKTEDLVDYEDRLAQDFIAAAEMLHVLGEFFGMPLVQGIWAQRLLMAQAYEELIARGVDATRLRREGDDLYLGLAKLSVSIVTASPVSCLLHAAINIDPTGAPVEALGLAALGIADPLDFARAWVGRFEQEWKGIAIATTKVRPV